MLNFRMFARPEVGGMRLAGESVDGCRFGLGAVARAGIRKQVVDQPRSGHFQNGVRMAQRISQVFEDRGLIQVWVEAVERIAGALALLAHDGSADHHAQGIERDLGAVAVRIGHTIGREHSIVDLRRDDIANGVAHFNRQQVVAVIGDNGRVIEGVDKPPRQEEMPARLFQFLTRIAFMRGVEDSARGDPPPPAANEFHVLSLMVKDVTYIRNEIFKRLAAAVDLGEQPGREGKLVSLSG